MSLHSEQYARVTNRFDVSSEDMETEPTTDEAKKWKDLFLEAAALWLSCELSKAAEASDEPDTPED